MQPKTFTPQVHGCRLCSGGRNHCEPHDPRCGSTAFWQATASQDQEPFSEDEDRRYVAIGRTPVYCSPAEEEAIRLARTEQAVLENVLSADQAGLLTDADMVNLPAHYARFKLEPIRFIVENGLNWFQGNIIKYASRAQHKHATPAEDIAKIIRYAEMWADQAAGDANWWMRRGDPRRAA